MITRALHDSGLHLLGNEDDALIEAAEDNPEGFWEHKAVVACNDELLEATGGAWDNPPASPPRAADDPRVAHLADDANAALAGLRDQDHWGFKDPRLCLTAPFWLDLEPELRFIVCVRHPLEVALSLKRRNQNSYSLGLHLWERYYATVLESVPSDRLLVTHYDSFFDEPDEELARLCAFADLEPTAPRVREDLRHHTVDVALDDAGVSDSVCDLYAALCKEAGVAVPTSSSHDDGRVRRLVLDGAVAARHADQRQAAIDRLQEREEEFRARIAELERDRASVVQEQKARMQAVEEDHRVRTRELETRVSSASGEVRAMHTESLRTVKDLRQELEASSRQLHELEREVIGAVARVDAFIATPRRAVRKAKRSGEQHVIRPVRRVLGRLKRAASPRARALQHRLPPQAEAAMRSAKRAVEGGPRTAITELEAAARRMPPPAQRGLRLTRTAVRRARAQILARKSRPGARTVPSAPRPSRGPAFNGWKNAYTDLVDAAVAPGRPWLVLLPGSPSAVRGVRSPPGTPFPQVTDGAPLRDDLAHIAHLEALRFEGHERLLVPEGSRHWYQQQVLLRDHLMGTFRTLHDGDGAGLAFDLTAGPSAHVSTLRNAVAELCLPESGEIAVLDWTSCDIAAELPGIAVFRPPAGENLPYLDNSVPVVVATPSCDMEESTRVATQGVVVVDDREQGAGQILEIRELAVREAVPTPHVLVISADPDDDQRWRSTLTQRAADDGADVRFTAIDAGGTSEADGYDAVVVVQPYVLPLPAGIRLAAAHAIADPETAIAGKVIASDGVLESAGGTVFADRSVALIGRGSAEVRAPWHDYARPVCWSPGIVAASAELWHRVVRPDLVRDAAFLREWCSQVWAVGGSVRYRPDVVTVRVRGDGGEASTPLHESSWQRVLDLRPQRPTDLSDGAWRFLLARDDVEACRR